MSVTIPASSLPQRIKQNVEQPVAILNACDSGAWERVGGIPLIARFLYHLNQLGMRKVIVLLSTDKPTVPLATYEEAMQVHYRQIRDAVPAALLSIAREEQAFLYIDAAHLIDPRLVAALANANETTLAYPEPADKTKQLIRAAAFKREGLHRWATQGSAALIRDSKDLFPAAIDPFSPEVRGPVFPLFLEVRSKAEAQKATRLLIRSNQNQVMDLPAQYLDPPLENALTLLLCNTPVTPNMVTFLGVAIAMGVAWLFWHGYFLIGALGTFFVEVLDGVDGKLARTKLQYSKLGQYEDVIDYFYETSWYISLGVGLHNMVHTALPAVLAGLMVVSNTVDNILYATAKKWYSKSIDLFSPFDATFRRIAGRRNIYGFMFIIGFLIGYPLYTFAAAALWAVATAGIHGIRLKQFGKAVKHLHEP